MVDLYRYMHIIMFSFNLLAIEDDVLMILIETRMTVMIMLILLSHLRRLKIILTVQGG